MVLSGLSIFVLKHIGVPCIVRVYHTYGRLIILSTISYSERDLCFAFTMF